MIKFGKIVNSTWDYIINNEILSSLFLKNKKKKINFDKNLEAN